MNKVFFILPDAENPFFSSMAIQLQRKLTYSGRVLIVLNSDNSTQHELDNIRLVKKEATSTDVDGLVFISSGANIKSYDMVKELATDKTSVKGLPVVIVDREVLHPENYKCNILCDNMDGMFSVVEYFKEMGHRNLGFVTGREDTDPAQSRLDAFRKACEKQELCLNEKFIFEGQFTFVSGRNAARQYCQLSKDERPTAVFCSNDLSAAGFMQGLDEVGVRVPDDVSIIGFDGAPVSRWLTPPLTTVVQPIARIAEHIEYALLFEKDNEMGIPLDNVVWVKPVLAKRHTVKKL